ncbi:YraN family protein [Candidatus Macondimonas diazotrophica]|uniref:UPF0102 protein E4680_05115 n=1 Tax=Candidatus Macondimonas diazotrophica TaxID=2305248 RepID=A0A4Z0F9E0_9GAMM|nr:YraN family protein [Candidatus Macondimonas diazotrophica]NCU00229.1 YraN family protein [Candidatus Macondimonas diazotrophica]TFZ83022.1 YraN family protein [Candidatus Macondimonas diazotrophica]HBG29385.1 YraN family protein [Gammaproteobacteria bacterium]HBG51267.1 YraN family protein [Gammaproteobacteria bacterium]
MSGSGAQAEDIALEHLLGRGLQLITRNYRCRGGEIDLIMSDKQILVFIEVRHRTRTDFGTPEATVSHSKRRRLVLAARTYLYTHLMYAARPMRFDVLAIQGPLLERRIRWVQNAFASDE